MNIEIKVMQKIKELEDDYWEIEKLEVDERYMGNNEYRNEIIIRLLQKKDCKRESALEPADSSASSRYVCRDGQIVPVPIPPRLVDVGLNGSRQKSEVKE